MTIKRFEEIEAWQEARKLAQRVYAFARSEQFRKDFGLSGQIQQAAVSVMSNIAEGFDSDSKIEFLRFLRYSRRSASEVQSHLYVALDQAYIHSDQFDEAYDQAEKVRRFIAAFMWYLKGSSAPAGKRVLTGQRANGPTGEQHSTH